MMRRVTLHDIPATVGIQHGPSQVIFARDGDGRPYVDPDDKTEVATTVAWFGWTREPAPAELTDRPASGCRVA